MYNPKRPYIVFSYDYYNSDNWDPYEFGMVYDKSRSFFDQLKKLLEKVPKCAVYLSPGDGPSIESPYANYAGGLNNCYLVFNSGPGEEMMYSRGLRNCRQAVDCYFGTQLEECYECVNVQQSSKVFWGNNSSSCLDSYFIEDCRGCSNCFGCVGLRNQKYYFFNEPLFKEEYQERVLKIFGSYDKIKEAKNKFESHRLKFPSRQTNNFKTVNSTGDYLFECNNVHDSMEAVKSEDSKFIFSTTKVKDSMGIIGYGTQSELLLECVGTGYSSKVIGSVATSLSHDIWYSFFLNNCKNCIGCDSLKNAEFCILNKQYTKEEFEVLREHIRQELTEKGLHGLAMPQYIAPFAYNETIGQDNFPLSHDQALKLGLSWEDEIQETHGKETIKISELPDNIRDVKDSITKEILACEVTGRNFKITPQELSFYKKMNIPLPRKSFFTRHLDRLARRGPYQLFDRNCVHCGKEIKTSYAPDHQEIVYCEECYQKETI
ncbi:MAG: hypothetical protein NT094_05660 [Candidatus Staskawiczbacteria bacterium]|nr:hypothetical protein [Candidatus Staskawiczbacteria bacterium]